MIYRPLMTYRLPALSLIAVLLTANAAGHHAAQAEDCETATETRASVEHFLDQAQEAQDAGQGDISINDVLVGVTNISDDDQQALDARDQVKMTRSDATHGTYESRGPERIAIEGLFAGKETLFRIPKLASGHYELTLDGATLTYDTDHMVEVGLSLVGIHVYKDVHRQVITRDRMAFFFAGNDGSEPDRCYIIKS